MNPASASSQSPQNEASDPCCTSTMEIHHRWRSIIVMGCLWLICLFAVFSPGAPAQLSYGLLFVSVGALMLVFPPEFRLPWAWFGLGIAFVGFSCLCFLPSAWFSAQEWRDSLGKLGLHTGGLVTTHPRQSFEWWINQTIILLTGLFILCQKVSPRAGQILSFLFPCGIAIYVVVCMMALKGKWEMAWDANPDFGFFPNRNHTATLLSMGALTAVVNLFQGIKSGKKILAALAALVLLICLWALIRYSISRAGLLLFGAGLALWVIGLGRAWISVRFIVTIVVCTLIGGGIFLTTDTALKDRIVESINPVPTGAHTNIGRTITSEGEVFDLRLLIYKDALSMIAREPWVGVGQGMFRYVFPQHRWWSSISNDSQNVHPESDWLWVAAESGLPAAIILAAGVALVFFTAFRGDRKEATWPLRCGCLVAAALVPLHGLFDVPGHRQGLAWSAVFLIALAMRDFGAVRTNSLFGRWLWRLTGCSIILTGALLLRAEWFGGPQSAVIQPIQLAVRARALHAIDQQQQETNASAPSPSIPASVDRLETAISLVDEAIRIAPLDQDLHYLKGSLALYFDEKDALVDQSYSIQRALDPTWVRLSLRQAFNWSGIDPARTLALWHEAMKRAEWLESIAPVSLINSHQTLREILDQSARNENLSRLAAKCIGTNPIHASQWVTRAHITAVNDMLPSLLAGPFASTWKPLHEIWTRRDGAAATKWLDSR